MFRSFVVCWNVPILYHSLILCWNIGTYIACKLSQNIYILNGSNLCGSSVGWNWNCWWRNESMFICQQKSNRSMIICICKCLENGYKLPRKRTAKFVEFWQQVQVGEEKRTAPKSTGARPHQQVGASAAKSPRIVQVTNLCKISKFCTH